MSDTIRIIPKKRYEFYLYEKGAKIQTVTVEPFIFTEVPAWVADDDLFKIAVKCKNIEVSSPVKNDITIDEIDILRLRAKELGIKSYGTMGLDKLKDKIAQIEAEPMATQSDENAAGTDNNVTES